MLATVVSDLAPLGNREKEVVAGKSIIGAQSQAKWLICCPPYASELWSGCEHSQSITIGSGKSPDSLIDSAQNMNTSISFPGLLS